MDNYPLRLYGEGLKEQTGKLSIMTLKKHMQM